MKFQLGLSSKARRLFACSLATKNPSDGEKPGSQLDAVVAFPDRVSSAEIFLDSRAWLDSDCEDDFFSVNGEFTPSRGSTPVHQIGAGVVTPLNNAVLNNSISYNNSKKSPTDRRPKFAELLLDKVHVVALDEEEYVSDHTLKIGGGGKVGAGEEYMYRPAISSVAQSKAGPDGQSKNGKEKGSNCCFPSLSFTEWKSKKMSPERSNGC